MGKLRDYLQKNSLNGLILAVCGAGFLWQMLLLLGFYSSGNARLVWLAATLVLCSAPLLLCCYHTAKRWVYEISSVETCLGLLLSVYLCATGFGGSFAWVEVLSLLLCLVLIFCYITGSACCSLLYYGILAVAYWNGRVPDADLFFLVFLALAAPMGILLYRERGLTKSLQAYLLFTGVIWVFYFWNHGEKIAFGTWFYVVYACLMVLYLTEMRMNEEKPFYARPLRAFTVLMTLYLFLVGAVSGGWRERILSETTAGINAVLFALLVIMCILYMERILRGRITPEELLAVLCYYISFAFYIYYEFYYKGSAEPMHQWYLAAAALLCIAMLWQMWQENNLLHSLIPPVLAAGSVCTLQWGVRMDIMAGTLGAVLVLALLGTLWKRRLHR